MTTSAPAAASRCAGGRGAATPSAAAVAAGQEGDDDAEERHDAADYRLQDVAHAGDDGHDHAADCAQDGLDAGYYGTHVRGCL